MDSINYGGVLYFRVGTNQDGSSAYMGFNAQLMQWEYLLSGFTVNGHRVFENYYRPPYDSMADQTDHWGTSPPQKQDWESMANDTVLYTPEWLAENSLVDQIAKAKGQALAPNTLAAFSGWIYNYHDGEGDPMEDQVPDGFTLVAERSNETNGFFGVVLRQTVTNDLIVITRGTDEAVDWIANLALPGGADFTQATDMQALITNGLASGNHYSSVYFTGHSLGGALATIGLAMAHQIWGPHQFRGMAAVTFGTAPAGDVINSRGLASNFVNYNTVNYLLTSDPVGLTHFVGVPGITYQMPTPWTDFLNNPIANHAISKYMGAVPESVYALTISANDVPAADPIFIDLDGDGVEFVGAASAPFAFDFDQDGMNDETSWVARDDAVLFLDLNNDNQITEGRELAFKALWGGQTDLAALGLADGDKDGRLTSADTVYGLLRLWQDKDGDGQIDAGEVSTLAEAGLISLDLDLNGDSFLLPGAVVRNTSTVAWNDGRSTAAWDVDLFTTDILPGQRPFTVNDGGVGVLAELGTGQAESAVLVPIDTFPFFFDPAIESPSPNRPTLKTAFGVSGGSVQNTPFEAEWPPTEDGFVSRMADPPHEPWAHMSRLTVELQADYLL